MNRAMQNQYTPDYAVPPGELLLETIEERGMTQVELAERTGRKEKTINEIIKGKAPITPETAIQLERVLGVSSSFWNNLERNYQALMARIEEKKRLAAEVDWLKKFPIKEMINKHWIRAFDNKVDQMEELLNYFGVASPAQWSEVWQTVPVSYRKSQAFDGQLGALSAWLRQAELAAQQVECLSYDKTKFIETLNKIRPLTKEQPEMFQSAVINFCAEAGVAIVFVPELPKAHVSGATRWLTPSKALIQLSLRHRTDDHLWFSFFHEAGHILHHGKKDFFIEAGDENEGKKEQEANSFAADFLIPPSDYRAFIARGGRRFSKTAIKTFAAQIGTSPGVVVGRLQHDGYLPPTHCNDLKVRFVWADNA